MANAFWTVEQASAVALRLAEQDLFLSSLISRNIVDPLKGGGAGTAVQLRIPSALVARERGLDDKTSEVIFDEITERRITVDAANRAYSGVSLSDGDMSLDIVSFTDQVLGVQIDAVVDWVENAVAEELTSIPLLTGAEAAGLPVYDPAKPVPYFTALRKILRERGVPQTGIRAIVGTEVYANLLDAQAVTDASQSGSNDALRNGNVGKVRGFDVAESTRVGETEIMLFHKDAYSLSVKPPAPAHGQEASTASSNGFGLRVTRGFDMRKTAHLSLVDTMFAVVPLPMVKVARDYATKQVTVTDLGPGVGASLRVDVADDGE